MFKEFFFRKSCRFLDNVLEYSSVGGATDDNMEHAHFRLGTEGYKHTLRLCNSYCFSTATMKMLRYTLLANSE